MNKTQIIQEMEDLIYKSSTLNFEKVDSTLEKATYSQNINLGFELSNKEVVGVPNNYSYKLDNINDALEIRESLTKEKTPNKDEVINQIIKQFNIDVNSDVYIVLKIQ